MKKVNKRILQLAVPSIISNITVPLLGLVDVAIVGHIGDAAYIGAIAVGSMLFNVIYWLFGFLRMGTSGMTSQALGRRDLAEVLRLLVRSLSIGVGIGVQLPVFNRNKGAIRSARFRLRQNEILVLQERNNIRNEIIECLENYKSVYSFLEENGVNRSIQSEMDKMPDVYTKNLLMKNISMVEYMDFMDSYHASKEVLLRSRKELRLQFERLQFAIGQTIK